MKIGYAVVALLLGSGALAHAEPSSPAQSVALSFIRLPGAEQCSSLKQVAARVDVLLSRAAFVPPGAAQLFIEASIRPAQPQGWHVWIVLADDTGATLGTRELLVDKPDCTAATDAASLAIALMIDPEAAAQPGAAAVEALPEVSKPATAPLPEPTPPPRHVSRPHRSSVVVKPKATREPWLARLSAGGAAEAGRLPGIALGATGAVRLSSPGGRFAVDVAGTYLPTRSADVTSSAGGDFSLAAGALSGWFEAWRRGSGAVGLGAGVELGNISAVGRGFTTNRYAQSWFVDSALYLELAWQLSDQFYLLIRPAFGLAIWKDKFEGTPGNAGRSTIFEPAPVFGRLTISVGFGP
jgi:hypothetical protein